MHQTLTLCGEARPECTVRGRQVSYTCASLECVITDYYKLIHEMNVIVTWEPMYSLSVCI